MGVYSLQIARSRWLGDGSGWNPSESGNNHSASINDKIFGLEDGEGDTEVFVPAQCLEGLVPQTLLEQYRFWQIWAQHLEGVSTWRYFNDDSILIKIMDTADSKDGDETPWIRTTAVATIVRLKRGGVRDMTLMNLDPSSVLPSGSRLQQKRPDIPGGLRTLSTVSDFSSGVDILGRLRDLFCRMDNLSHILLWTSSDALVGDYCELSRVELPRLNACFLSRGTR